MLVCQSGEVPDGIPNVNLRVRRESMTPSIGRCFPKSRHNALKSKDRNLSGDPGESSHRTFSSTRFPKAWRFEIKQTKLAQEKKVPDNSSSLSHGRSGRTYGKLHHITRERSRVNRDSIGKMSRWAVDSVFQAKISKRRMVENRVVAGDSERSRNPEIRSGECRIVVCKRRHRREHKLKDPWACRGIREGFA
jgi:hypothetical protein